MTNDEILHALGEIDLIATNIVCRQRQSLLNRLGAAHEALEALKEHLTGSNGGYGITLVGAERNDPRWQVTGPGGVEIGKYDWHMEACHMAVWLNRKDNTAG